MKHHNRFSLVLRACLARFPLNEAPSSAALSTLSSAIAAEAVTARAAEASAAGAASSAQTDATNALGSVSDLQTVAITGAGVPLSFAATTEVLGDGSEHNVGTIAAPGGVSITNGHKYRINGTVRVVGGATDPANAGKHLATLAYHDVVLLRSAGSWVLDTAGEMKALGGESITGALVDYFAVNSTDAPQFGETASGHLITMFYAHVTGTYVTLEGDFVMADIGA